MNTAENARGKSLSWFIDVCFGSVLGFPALLKVPLDTLRANPTLKPRSQDVVGVNTHGYAVSPTQVLIFLIYLALLMLCLLLSDDWEVLRPCLDVCA